MKLNILKGATDQTVYLFIQASNVTTGAGLTGLAFNTASLVCYYVRPLGTATQLSLVTQTVTGAHADGGFVEVDATNLPGIYRLDLSDAIVASGVNSVVVMLKGAANMAPITLEIQLVSYNPNDATRLGLSALPNANVEAAGGLYTRGSGAGQINQAANGQIDVNLVTWLGTAPLALASQLVQVSAAALQAGVVTTASIADGAYTAAKFASGAFDAVWSVGTRTLTSFGSLVSDVATAVWDAGTRTLTAFGFTVDVGSLDAAAQEDVRDAVGLASANLDSQLGGIAMDAAIAAGAAASADSRATDIQSRIPAALVSGRMASVAQVVDDKTGYALSGAGVDAVWDEAVDGSVTARESLRLANSANGAKTSGGGTASFAIRDLADTKDRVTATVDANGNRSAVSRDLS